MKFVASLRQHYSIHTILPLAVLLSACGGSPLEDEGTMLPPAQLGATPAMQGAAKRPPAQGEFNLDIWNEHKWYECDCARESTAPVP
ncbi:hypothetical protein [Noviherbaspirillum sp.]|uniref:hypothetical protein n=1 Tax=Noviherbaspirillum sp. TaxID=1926288 RepID=UPI002D4C7E33|nr:hypothetical protein [Noviherbaspirillum sp.]HZW20681.1 hypothetical protein [Noviherbaspirillum sp.]